MVIFSLHFLHPSSTDYLSNLPHHDDGENDLCLEHVQVLELRQLVKSVQGVHAALRWGRGEGLG